MRAVVFEEHGGVDKLRLTELPKPQAVDGEVVIKVKAFGLNRAETYMRKGLFGPVAKVTGIECVGLLEQDPSGELPEGQTVAAIMGGLGRTRNGSYADYTCVPRSNVFSLSSDLGWDALAAINLAHGHGATVIATTRSPAKQALLEGLGAKHVLVEDGELAEQARALYPAGVDAVLDIVGNSTLRDSLKSARKSGRVCMAGFLGGLNPVDAFNPLFDLPVGVHLSFFASLALGSEDFPLSDIPMQKIVDDVAAGVYRAAPIKTFALENIRDAHRLMESNDANGKIVVLL